VGTGKTVTVSGLTISGTDAANYVLTQPTTTADITKATLTVTALDKIREYGVANPDLTASYTGFKNGETLETSGVTGSPALSTGATSSSPVSGSPYTITVSAGSLAAGNYDFKFVNGLLTINKVTTTTIAAISAPNVQYSDALTLTAIITPVNCCGGETVSGSVIFTIGSETYGPVSVQATGQATKVVNIRNLPGTYDVKAVFTSSNPNWADSNNNIQPPPQLTVLPEDAARVGMSFYTGETFVWTTTPTSSTATVTLVATLKNAPNDEFPGDIRAARVSFFTTTDGGVTMSPISSAQNLPVGLVDINNGNVGTASAVAQFNIGSQNFDIYNIVVKIGGAYTGTDTMSILIAKATPGQILGAATLDNTGSAGLIKGASGEITEATLGVKYNKAGTNPQGKVEFQWQSFYNPSSSDLKLNPYRQTIPYVKVCS
jgi:hypothetical protein